jgi:hypothetical protein
MGIELHGWGLHCLWTVEVLLASEVFRLKCKELVRFTETPLCYEKQNGQVNIQICKFIVL